MVQFLMANYKEVLSIILGLDYMILLLFPSSPVSNLLKMLGNLLVDAGAQPPAPPAA